MAPRGHTDSPPPPPLGRGWRPRRRPPLARRRRPRPVRARPYLSPSAAPAARRPLPATPSPPLSCWPWLPRSWLGAGGCVATPAARIDRDRLLRASPRRLTFLH